MATNRLNTSILISDNDRQFFLRQRTEFWAKLTCCCVHMMGVKRLCLQILPHPSAWGLMHGCIPHSSHGSLCCYWLSTVLTLWVQCKTIVYSGSNSTYPHHLHWICEDSTLFWLQLSLCYCSATIDRQTDRAGWSNCNLVDLC